MQMIMKKYIKTQVLTILKSSPKNSFKGKTKCFQRSVNFKMSFWYHCLDQNTNDIFSKMSVLASKKRSNQKNKRTLL